MTRQVTITTKLMHSFHSHLFFIVSVDKLFQIDCFLFGNGWIIHFALKFAPFFRLPLSLSRLLSKILFDIKQLVASKC